jgi:ABC-type lipoprotein release transport system permease subunit
MSTLFRFTWRELCRAKGRMALIVLILAIQATALGGGFLSQESLTFTRDAWSERLHLADLDVRFVAASPAEMPSLDAIRSVPGVSEVERRFVMPGSMETKSGAALPVVIHYLDPAAHPKIDDIEVLTGSWLVRGAPELALVDRSAADAQGFAIGDEIVVNPHRFSSRFKIGGTALSAEYLVPTSNPNVLVPVKGSIAVIYASREALDRVFPDELYNDVVVGFSPGADPRRTTDAVLAAMGKLDIERVVTKESAVSHRVIDVLVAGFQSVMPTVASIMALIAAIVTFISMHRLVAERRREIGCLLAMGYSPAELAGCFFGIGLVPGVIGGMAGIPGAMLFARQLARSSASAAGFPDPTMTWSATWLGLGAGSALLVGLVSAIPALAILRARPNQALRGGAAMAFTGLPRPLERLLSGSVSVRYAVRNVFRRLPLSFATATLIALAVAWPAALLTSLTSRESWVKEESASARWDAIASFKAPLEETQVTAVLADKGIAGFDGYAQGFVPVRRGDGSVAEMRMRGVPVGGEISTPALTAGRLFASDNADEAILSTTYAGKHPPHLGEVLHVTHGGVSRSLVVVGLVADGSLASILVPRGTAQRLLGLEGKMSGAYLRYGTAASSISSRAAPVIQRGPSKADVTEKLDFDEAPAHVAAPVVTRIDGGDRTTKAALLDEELVTTVEVRTEYLESSLQNYSHCTAIVMPFIGLGGAMAFFFLLSVLGYLLVERETEYATLRSMGYATVEIAIIVLTEVGVLAATGLILSVGAWALTASVLRDGMTEAWFWVPLDLRLHDFALCAVPTCLLLAAAAVPGIRGLARLDLASALRGRALG